MSLPPAEVARWIATAAERRRPGDVLLLALEAAPGDRLLLAQAARHLCELGAHAGALEVSERLLALDPGNHLARELSARSASLERASDAPMHVLFSGHMIDRPDRDPPRFPPEDEAPIAEALRETLARVARPGAVALVGGASGGDILFAEACVARAVPLLVHLPFDEDRFVETSVRPAGQQWVARYRALREAARECLVMTDHLGSLGSGLPFVMLNRWMLASARAQGMDAAVLVALWDGRSAGDGPGGTADMVASVRALGGRVMHVPTVRR